MSDRIPMSQDGYNKIKAEVERMEREERPVIAQAVADARAEGDLRENAEYHGQRERLGMLDAKIRQLRDKLARASIIDPSKLPKGEVAFGAKVRVKDLDFEEEEVFILVGAGDEDYDSGKILLTSPIGQALLGKKIGEIAEVAAPKGTIRFEVLVIEFE